MSSICVKYNTICPQFKYFLINILGNTCYQSLFAVIKAFCKYYLEQLHKLRISSKIYFDF